MSIYNTKEYKDSVKMKISYEWWVEKVDKHEDIQDCYKIDFKEWPIDQEEGLINKLVLKRFWGCDLNGIDGVGHAYVLDGILEDNFDSGHKVPERYKKRCENNL